MRLASGEAVRADVVVSNADSATTYRHLVPASCRRRWTDRRVERARYSMGLFVWYFTTRFSAFRGAGFGLEPILTQTGWFRPHNLSEEIPGLYLMGAGTHPGAGVPGVLSSAKVLEAVLPRHA